MTKILEVLNAIVWGAPALILILGVGLYLSMKLGFPQITLFPSAVFTFFAQMRPGKKGERNSSYQALCTALGATVGTGNLVGVAGAICIGGPGAVFWMWVCAFFGMATKYAEAVLAVRYREREGDGSIGGPMYVIFHGMGERYRPLAVCYSLFGLVAAFGVGNATQINAVITGINTVLCRFGGKESVAGNFLMGLILAAIVGSLLLGGAKRIGNAAEKLVPFAAAAYLLLSAGVLLTHRASIPQAFGRILTGAFCPRAVTGGMLGSAFQALRIGCSRGVFTNEAGMGTASIAHASAQVQHPGEQGLMGIMEVFLDTIVICTLTALVILVTDVPIPYGTDAGANLTTDAFCTVYGDSASLWITGMLICFAIATILGWGLYGARCAQFLFGNRAWRGFAMAQSIAVVCAAVTDTALVWQLSETVNGLMAIPNLLALTALTPELCVLTVEFKKTLEESKKKEAPVKAPLSGIMHEDRRNRRRLRPW